MEIDLDTRCFSFKFNNIRFGRIVQTLEDKGEDISKLSPPPSLAIDYITCPHCFRKFGPTAAERHISVCKDIVNRPPRPPGHENSLALPNINKPTKSPDFFLNNKKTNGSTRSIASPTVECQHCLRAFAPRAAERHIPICEKVRNKPKGPKKADSMFKSKEVKRSFRVINDSGSHCETCFAVLPTEALFCMMCGCKK